MEEDEDDPPSETDDEDDNSRMEYESRGRGRRDAAGSRGPANHYQPLSGYRRHSRSPITGFEPGWLEPDVLGLGHQQEGACSFGPPAPDPRQPAQRGCVDDRAISFAHFSTDRTVSIVVLIVSSVFMSMCAQCLVEVIDEVSHQSRILSESVIGLIILPIVGNMSEYFTVVTVAARDNLDLAIAVSVGSAIQIALCVTPLTVLVGWILDRDLELSFSFFEMSCLVGTTLMVSLLVLNDGSSALRTNGLKGALMCACYLIIGYVPCS